MKLPILCDIFKMLHNIGTLYDIVNLKEGIRFYLIYNVVQCRLYDVNAVPTLPRAKLAREPPINL